MGKHLQMRGNARRQDRGIQKNTEEVYYQSAVVKLEEGIRELESCPCLAFRPGQSF